MKISQILGEKWASSYKKLKDLKQDQPKEDYTEKSYNQNVKSERQENDFESSERKVTHHIQESPQVDFSAEILQTRRE